MARKISVIKHDRVGIEVDLKLDVKTNMFEAEYGGETFCSKDGDEVRDQVLDAIDAGFKLIFKPVIRISGSTYPAETNAEVDIDIHRFWICQTEDNKRFKVGFERGKKDQFSDPNSDHYYQHVDYNDLPFVNERSIVIDYTDKTWNYLVALVTEINTLHTRLYEAITNDKIESAVKEIRSANANIGMPTS